MTKQEARIEIWRDRKNIDDLTEARSIAWDAGDKEAYKAITSAIRDLNQDIHALTEAYGIEEVEA